MTEPRKLMDDLAQVMGSSLEVLSGFKAEVEKLVQNQIQTVLKNQGLVTKEEFEIVRAMAVKAREEQEKLQQKIEILEQKLAAK